MPTGAAKPELATAPEENVASAAATVLALGSAVLHAAWNLLVKTSSDRLIAAWGLYVTGGLLFLPVFLVIDRPGADTLRFLAASNVLGAGLVLSAASVASGRAGRLGPRVRREWPRFLVGGVCSTLAYSMVLAAARLAPSATSPPCASPR